jgi:hypothetical protein
LTVGIHYIRLEDAVTSVGSDGFRIERKDDPTVRVPDEVLKCVGFIGEVEHQDETGMYGEHRATGFFVAIPCESQHLKHSRTVYFVTAKHVAEEFKNSHISFWVNRKGGGVTTVPDIVGERWWFHPTDETADVAILQVCMNPQADIVPIAVETIGLPDRITEMVVGIGDEVYAPGLFTEVDSTDSMKPIVRHGNIAMMANTIQTKYGMAEVYLVEARSIGGISGSPVFTRNTLAASVKMKDGSTTLSFSNGHGETLLGLVHGHWDVRESEINSPTIKQDRKQGVNYGIAIVVPAIKIYETLYRAELIAMRKQQEQEEVNSSIPDTDVAPAKENRESFTKEDFENALKKVSRKKN